MTARIIKVNSQKLEEITGAAEIIKEGNLVAFPTETVYGLGANALDKKAIKKIFEAKGRPLDNPLIVHVADYDDIFKIAQKIPKIAKTLATKFWPGPLTLIFFKKRIIPDEVTAGGNTVAIRIPKNKIALELIKSAGVPIAAPSANLAGRLSPTTAQHVFEDLGNKIDLILDGGRTKIGIESTVVDLTINPPQILRPGGISFEKLKKVLKNLQLHPSLLGKKIQEKTKSPGMKYRHYAPQAHLILIKGDLKRRGQKIQDLIVKYKKEGKKVGLLTLLEREKFYKGSDLVLSVGSEKNLKEVAQNLFKTLRKFDEMGMNIILSETFSRKEIGFAIMDRLEKAAKKGKLD